MPPSPLQDAEGVLGIDITSGGEALPDGIAIISVHVRLGVDRVPEASLVFADGDAEMDGFPVSDGPTLAPGTRISVQAGYGARRDLIFTGVVARQSLSIGGAGQARLAVECRDVVARMDVERRSAHYLDMDDGDALRSIITGHGLRAQVSSQVSSGSSSSPSGLSGVARLQHDCTDWQFLLAQAAARGCVVNVADGTVTVAPPRASDAAVLAVTYGTDVIGFEAEVEADVGTRGRSAADRPTATGRVRFQGSALAVPDCRVELKNLGARFSGEVWVRAVNHHVEAGEWQTEVEFGAPAASTAARAGATASPTASPTAPPTSPAGLFHGRVTRLESDPAGEHRIQVSLPGPGLDSLWARLLQVQASKDFGAFFVPEIGDEVLVGYLADDPACPVVLGSLYSRERPPAEALSDENPVRSLVTRGRSRLVFDDRAKTVTVGTAAGNAVVLDDRDRSILLTDMHGNRVRLGADGITLSSVRDIRLTAPGSITLEAGGALALGAQGDARLSGLNLDCQARIGVRVQGSATAELSASGQTTVRGAMVMIN